MKWRWRPWPPRCRRGTPGSSTDSTPTAPDPSPEPTGGLDQGLGHSHGPRPPGGDHDHDLRPPGGGPPPSGDGAARPASWRPGGSPAPGGCPSPTPAAGPGGAAAAGGGAEGHLAGAGPGAGGRHVGARLDNFSIHYIQERNHEMKNLSCIVFQLCNKSSNDLFEYINMNCSCTFMSIEIYIFQKSSNTCIHL